MAFEVSWDPESEAEFSDWVDSNAADDKELTSAVRLLTAFLEGIASDGPDDPMPGNQAKRSSDGKVVELHCFNDGPRVRRCYGVCENKIRLLVIGPFGGPNALDTARQRAENW